jgi:hypothetical protein
MSRSESTTKARTACRIERQRIDAINGRGSDLVNQFEADLAALGVSARRYGNQRHAKASAKAHGRRAERRGLVRDTRMEVAAL